MQSTSEVPFIRERFSIDLVKGIIQNSRYNPVYSTGTFTPGGFL